MSQFFYLDVTFFNLLHYYSCRHCNRAYSLYTNLRISGKTSLNKGKLTDTRITLFRSINDHSPHLNQKST